MIKKSRGKFSSETTPTMEGDNLDLKNLITEVQESGHVDLRSMSGDKVALLADWYRSDFESLAKNEKTEFLEQFMMTGEFSDSESIEYIRQIDPEARGEVGIFIYQVLSGVKFTRTFHECWDDIDHIERSKIIKEIVCDHQELALMIAPFTSLSHWSKEGELIGSLRRRSSSNTGEDSTNLQKKQFSDFDKNIELIEVMLEYAKRHPGERKEAIKNNLSQIAPELLIPYLDTIEDLDILDSDQVRAIASSAKNYLLIDKFLTATEREEKKSILKDLENYYPEKDKENIEYYPPSELTPRKLGVRLTEIKNRALLREAQTILGTFKERSQRLDKDKIEYLIDLVESGVPIFTQIDSLGLSKDEIISLINRCADEGNFPIGQLSNLADMKKFVEYSRRHASEPGSDLEQALVRYIINDLHQDNDCGFVGNTVDIYMEDFFEIFKPDDRQKITEAIIKFAPGIWLNNLSYTIKHEVMSLDELVERTATETYNFISNYHKILYHLHLLEQEGKPSKISIESLTEKVKEVFMAHPGLFLSSDNKSIIDIIYTPEEQHQFIDQQLKGNIDSDFFESLLDSRFKNDYSDRCKKLLWASDFLFSAVATTRKGLDNIKSIMKGKDLVDLVSKHVETADFYVIFSDLEFIAQLGSNPSKTDALVDGLLAFNNFKAIAQLNEAILSFENKEQKLRDSLKSLQKNKSKVKGDILKEQKKEITKIQLELDAITDTNNVKIRQNLVPIQEKTLTILDEACEQNRFLVFDDDILGTAGLDAAKYIKRDSPGYLIIDPQILFRSDIRHGEGDLQRYWSDSSSRLCENVFGKEKFAILIDNNKRLLAFRKTEYGRPICNRSDVPPETMEKIEAMNPFIEIHDQEKLSQDYYYTVLDKIKDTPFAELYNKQLQKIAAEKNKADGPRLNIKYFEPDIAFKQMAEKIFLLNSHPDVVEHANWIMALPENQRKELINLLEFALLNNLGFLKQILSEENFEEARKNLQEDIESLALKMFNLEEIEGLSFEDLSPNTIKALFIFYHQACKKDNRRNLAFGDFITHVLDGTYKSWRQWGSEAEPEDKSLNLDRLKEKKLIPKGLSLEQYQSWIQEEKLDFEEVFDYQSSDMKYGIREIIGTAIADEHISSESLDTSNIDDKYNNLIEPLRLLSDRQRELRELSKTSGLNEAQGAEYKQLAQKIIKYRQEHGDKINTILALKYLEELKNLSVHDLESQTITIEGKNRIPLKKVFKLLEDNFGDQFPDFISDISRIRQLIASGFEQIYGNQKISREKLHLTDKVDLETYIFIGEKPVVSCQHYNGRSGLNAGLLSYLADSNVKIIQMYNESGTIIARSILRLMEDDDGQPQLFMERVYSASPHPKINEAIINLAKLKADSMGVGLYTSEIRVGGEVESDKEPLMANLHNNGSRSTHVYTDTGGGNMPDGRFTIRQARNIDTHRALKK